MKIKVTRLGEPRSCDARCQAFFLSGIHVISFLFSSSFFFFFFFACHVNNLEQKETKVLEMNLKFSFESKDMKFASSY